MAKKFDADFNAEIVRTVKSFNQKIKRAEARGEKGLPDLRSVRELKAQFTTKQDMKKELAHLSRMLNNKEALKRIRTKEGTISNWEYDYIVDNLRATKKWVNRELEKARYRVKDYPEHLYAIREDVVKLEAERDYLDRDIRTLSARELRTVGAIEARMKRANLKTITGRKHFMNTLDTLLTARGMKLKDRQKIYDKLNMLSNEQYLELYKRHDIVGTIMGRYVPKDQIDVYNIGEDEEVGELLNEFDENLDEYILEAKDNVKKTNDMLFDATEQRYITKQEFKEKLQKIKSTGRI